MTELPRLGGKVRQLRRRQGVTQKRLAQALGISASYLNLIEHNKRPLSASMLIRLAHHFQVDLTAFSSDTDAELGSAMMEVFSDPLFDPYELSGAEVRDLATEHPTLSRAVQSLFQAYQASQQHAESLAERLADGNDAAFVTASRTPAEEVSDFVQRNDNYFHALEEGAEDIQRLARLGTGERDLYGGVMHYLKKNHEVETTILTVREMGGALRYFDPDRRTLFLSEVLRRGSRNFQLCHQLGLILMGDVIETLTADPKLTSDDARRLCRLILANYFASAVLMPYERFLNAARAERYDIELLGNRFRTSFEQVCHRLTSLRRPDVEGIPFHFVRVDIAGNISKRFSASGMRFARYSGACPLWNVYASFMTPGTIRTQVSRMPDGTTFFDVARTIRKDSGRFRARHSLQAINIGCEIERAKELVYADGVDLDNAEAAVPIGTTCRLCERNDCAQRAFASLQRPLRLNENWRGITFYAPGPDA